MCSACDLHRNDCQRTGQRAREPYELLETFLRWQKMKELRYADADKSADEVSAKEGAWLGKRGIDGAIDEDRGGSLYRVEERFRDQFVGSGVSCCGIRT